jgi:membrane-associated phospholipid phosphatase
VTMLAPPEKLLEKQLDFVNGYADLRADRAREIVSQAAPQWPFWKTVVPLQRGRHPRTLELMALALRLAKYAEMQFKNALAVLRPHELSPQIQPLIPTPLHASFPSGHCTEAHAVAFVLHAVVAKSGATQQEKDAVTLLRVQLMRQAARIAINRTVAGMHYPIDSLAGQTLGLSLGEYLLARCGMQNVPEVNYWTFGSFGQTDNPDFTGDELFDSASGKRKDDKSYAKKATANNQAVKLAVPESLPLKWLWDAAVKEWGG